MHCLFKKISSFAQTRNWLLLLFWFPLFLLLFHQAGTFEIVGGAFSQLSALFAKDYMRIYISPEGPKPSASINCTIWGIAAVVISAYSIVLRFISLFRKKKNFWAFLIPNLAVSIWLAAFWLRAYFILVSYIHQLGLTERRAQGVFWMNTSLVLCLVLFLLLSTPWENLLSSKGGRTQ